MPSFLHRRLRSIGYAFKGILLLIRTEGSIQVQLGIAVLVTIAGFWFDISTLEWCIQLLAIGLVMGVEGLNTAIEKLADYVQPEHDQKIGLIKDIAAGAVFITALVAAIVGLLIYLPKLF